MLGSCLRPYLLIKRTDGFKIEDFLFFIRRNRFRVGLTVLHFLLRFRIGPEPFPLQRDGPYADIIRLIGLLP
jgi:hypothetical protein